MKPSEFISVRGIKPTIGKVITDSSHQATCLLGFCAYGSGYTNLNDTTKTYTDTPLAIAMGKYIDTICVDHRQERYYYTKVYCFNDMTLRKRAAKRIQEKFNCDTSEAQGFTEFQDIFSQEVFSFLTDFEASPFYKEWEADHVNSQSTDNNR